MLVMRSTPAVFVCLVIAMSACAWSVRPDARSADDQDSITTSSAIEEVDERVSANSGNEAVGTLAPETGKLEFRPRVLNLGSSGRYVTCLLILPEGRTVRDVFIPSIQLNCAVYALTEFSPHNPVVDYENKGSLMLKFEKHRVQEVLPPGEDIVVWVSGWFMDSVPFVAFGSVTVTA